MMNWTAALVKILPTIDGMMRIGLTRKIRLAQICSAVQYNLPSSTLMTLSSMPARYSLFAIQFRNWSDRHER